MIDGFPGRSLVRPGWAGFLVVLSCAGGSVGAAAEPRIFEGQPLAEAIETLRAQGIEILYSSALVGPAMRVERVPEATTPVDMLRALVAPHGLTVQSGPGDSLLVVRLPAPGTIRGIVRLAGGGRLPVSARVAAGGAATSTGRGGGFELRVPAGFHAVQVVAAAHMPREIPGVMVEPGSTVELIVELSPEVSLEESVVVQREGSDGSVEIAPAQLREDPGLARDVMRAVSRTPGTAGSDVSAAIHVRGGRDDEMLVILDGLEIYQPFHVRDLGGGFLGLIDSSDVGRVGFFRGGFPVRYGNRMSGVLDIASVDPTGGTRTTVGVQTGQARVSSQGRFGGDRGLWLVSARAGAPKQSFPEWISESEYDPRYYDFLGKIERRVGQHVTVAAHLLFGLDDAESRTGPVLTDPPADVTAVDTSYGNLYGWITVRSAWKAKLAAETVISLGEIDRDRRVTVAGLGAARDDREFEVGGLTQAWTYDAGRHGVQWGVGYRHLRSDYVYTALPPGSMRPLTAGPSGGETFAYLSDTVRIGDVLEIEPGVRWESETYTGFDDGSYAPRLSLSWLAGERSVVRLGWGMYHQAQRIHELQIEDGVQGFSPSETADQFVAEYGFLGDDGRGLTLGAYYKEVDDVRPRFENLFDSTGFLPEARADRVLVAPDHSTMTGVELQLRGRAAAGLRWFAGYALSRAEDTIDGADVPRSWDQRHAVDAGISGSFDEGWGFGLTGSYHSGRPTTGATAETIDDETVIVFGPRNRERLPSYLRFDLQGSRAFRFGRHRLSFRFDVINLLDRDNVCCVDGFETVRGADGPTVERRDRRSLSRTYSLGSVWEF